MDSRQDIYARYRPPPPDRLMIEQGQSLIRLNVEDTAHIMTDRHRSYTGLDKHFASHGAVDHDKEYVRGIIHVNFAESYHSLLKRGNRLFGW